MPTDGKITHIFTGLRRVRMPTALEFGGSWFIAPSMSLIL
jgi:hypothetical protein